MEFIYFGAVYRKLNFIQGRRMHNNSILWVTLAAWITSAAAQGVHPGCNVLLTGSGSILSPNYPTDYPNNINCTWRLQSSSNATSIRLKFNTFNTESNVDTLRIYDEKGGVTLFSGSLITPIVTLGRTALLVFTTDFSVTHQGFNASFTSFDNRNISQCTTNDVYWCTNSRQCISNSWRCDNQWDCSSGEDELWCTSRAATSTLSPQYDCLRYGKFWCSRSSQCVSMSDRCDKYIDCTYGEDEANCPSVQPACNVLLTGSGSILSPNYPYDYPNNINCTWRLQSGSTATSIRLKFNTFNTESNLDTLRIYDEKGVVTLFSGSQITPIVTLGRTALLVFTTDNSVTHRGFNASFTSFDNRNISQCTTNDVYWCTNSRQCISNSWRCDNQWDCSNGEDELWCTSRAATSTLSPQYDCLWYGAFVCRRSRKCVSLLQRCDNYIDCTYGEDEANCSTTTTTISPQSECLRYGKFWCSRSSKCVPTSNRCDDYNDCTYGEDEADCALTTLKILRIVAACGGGVALLFTLVAVHSRATAVQRLRGTIRRSNNYIQTTASSSATVYSTPDTYASQFGAPNQQAGGPQGTGVVPMDQYAPPSYDVTIKAYATGQYAYPPAQSETAHPPSNAPSTAPPTH